jgi:hypothetical protein
MEISSSLHFCVEDLSLHTITTPFDTLFSPFTYYFSLVLITHKVTFTVPDSVLFLQAVTTIAITIHSKHSNVSLQMQQELQNIISIILATRCQTLYFGGTLKPKLYKKKCALHNDR